MKRSVKAAAAILTAVSMVTGLTACGSSGSASGTPAAQSEPKSDTSQNPASGGSEYTGESYRSASAISVRRAIPCINAASHLRRRSNRNRAGRLRLKSIRTASCVGMKPCWNP